MEPIAAAVGIDVSKDTLDVAMLGPKTAVTLRVPNTTEGFARTLRWAQAQSSAPLHVCLEATGTYHDALVAWMLERGILVSVLPSNRLKAFRESEGVRNKTDKLDAILLARYCQQKRPAPFVVLPVEVEQLRELLARLSELEVSAQQERNRLGNARMDALIRQQVSEHLRLLTDWERELKRRVRTLLKEHKEIKQAVKRLRSICGIGERTSWYLVSLLGADASRFPSAHHLVMYLGLDVARRDSGKRRAGQISKRGPAQIRGCLGMAALTAKTWDADMGQWARELAGRGQKGQQVRVSVMRKLLHLAYGVLKSQQDYDRLKAWPTHAQHAPAEERAA